MRRLGRIGALIGMVFLMVPMLVLAQPPVAPPPKPEAPPVAPGPTAAQPKATPGFTQESLLKQSKEVLSELLAIKSSGKLAPDQMKRLDDLLPRAKSVTAELEKPVSRARLPQLALAVVDLQNHVGVLKTMMK